MEIIELDATPVDEACASIGKDGATLQNILECQVFKHQLERHLPVPEGADAHYYVKANGHEFGTYREVAIKFNPNDQIASEWAYFVQDNTPNTWDQQARDELQAKGYLPKPAFV